MGLVYNSQRETQAGITNIIHTRLKLGDGKRLCRDYVVEDGRLRLKTDDESVDIETINGPGYKTSRTFISVSRENVYIDTVLGPLAGTGARCDIIYDCGFASFDNPRRMFIS